MSSSAQTKTGKHCSERWAKMEDMERKLYEVIRYAAEEEMENEQDDEEEEDGDEIM